MSDLNEAYEELQAAKAVLATHHAFRADESTELYRTRIEMDKHTDVNNRIAKYRHALRGGLFEDTQ